MKEKMAMSKENLPEHELVKDDATVITRRWNLFDDKKKLVDLNKTSDPSRHSLVRHPVKSGSLNIGIVFYQFLSLNQGSWMSIWFE